jgi:hypothetical protein
MLTSIHRRDASMLGHVDGAVKMGLLTLDLTGRRDSFKPRRTNDDANAQPSLRSIDLLDRVPSAARNLERRWSKSTVHKLAKPTKY